MKYRHYSPKATVVLYEAGQSVPSPADFVGYLGPNRSLGMITTKRWTIDQTSKSIVSRRQGAEDLHTNGHIAISRTPGFAGMLGNLHTSADVRSGIHTHKIQRNGSTAQLLEVNLGATISDIARGIFSALRELDMIGVDAIFVEGIDDDEGETAAAIMNRLRKAAEIKIGG
jgi:L-threonylcarbamoyladenylate synthase